MGQPAEPAPYLTKSAFADYQCCPGYAWLKRHQPSLIPAKPDPGAERARMNGITVDRLARERYAGGILIESVDSRQALVETATLLADPATTCLFQAAIVAEPGYLIRTDVLLRDGPGWRLLEVKGSCSVKPEHLDDAAYQVATLEMAGFAVTSVAILHLDGTYRRNRACDVQALFTEQDRTSEVRERLPGVIAAMEVARAVLGNDAALLPCECHLRTSGKRCPAFRVFHPDVPQEGSIYELANLTAGKLAQVVARGIVELRDWPDEIPLTAAQQRQVDVLRAGRPHVDGPGLRGLLNQLEYPIHFLDYETFSVPAPMYDGCWPYQQVPFQFSLHVVAEDGTERHHEYLATTFDQCSIHELAVRMAESIGPTGSVVVWNAPFERGRNRELAEALPEAAEFFGDVNTRMVDLMDSVRKGY